MRFGEIAYNCIIEFVADSVAIVSFLSGEDTTTSLEGFTIQNGFWNIARDGGGGPKFVNNIILGDSGRHITSGFSALSDNKHK